MTQKQSFDSSVSVLLQAIDPSGIADESVRQTVEILLNLVEELNSLDISRNEVFPKIA